MSRKSAIPVANIVVLILLALLAPTVLNGVQLFRLGNLLLIMLFAGAYFLVAGETGLLSLGHAALFGGGAYAGALLFRDELPIYVVIPAAWLLGAALGATMGYIALRSTGIYFAMLTLSLAQVVSLIVNRTPALGGQDGIANTAVPDLNIGSVASNLGGLHGLYTAIVVVVALSMLGLAMISRSSFGHVLRSIREDPVRSAALGLHVRRYQLLAMAVSGAFAATAGSLLAPLQGIVTPNILGWQESALPLIIILLGGLHSLWGAVIGAVTFEVLQAYTASSGASDIWMGAIIILIVVLFPEGLLGIWKVSKSGLLTRLMRTRTGPTTAATQTGSQGPANDSSPMKGASK